MYETLVEAKIPFPRLTTYLVSGIEFLGGSLLTVGFLSSLAGLCSHLKHDFAWSAVCSTVLERFACAGKRWHTWPVISEAAVHVR